MINIKKLTILFSVLSLILSKNILACDNLDESKLTYKSIFSICYDEKDFKTCEKNLENAKLKKLSNFVTKKENTLRLKIGNGKNIVFVDKNTKENQEKGDFEKYLFLDYFEDINYYLVSKTRIEYSEFIFINKKTGSQLQISGSGYILFSPNKKRFFNCFLDDGANSYSVFKIGKDKMFLEKEVVKFEENFGFSKKAKWLDDNTLCYAKEKGLPKILKLKE